MALVSFRCEFCKKLSKKERGEINRAQTGGYRLYCSRKCSGLGRRNGKTKAQRVAEKSDYDTRYRERNRAMLKAKKSAYFKRTYDPAKAAVERKKRMPLHVEYCRRPEYRRWKSAYDKKHKATKDYGPFAEVAMLTNDLNREIKERMTNAQIKWENKTSNKTQNRRREDG